MNTKLLLAVSGFFMAATGIAALFLPHEILRALEIQPIGLLPVIVQLLAAMFFAFGLVNWTARGSLIGGIYNRPVAIGNLVHFAIGGITLFKAAASHHRIILWVTAIVYLVFAAGFALVFFTSPVKRDGAENGSVANGAG